MEEEFVIIVKPGFCDEGKQLFSLDKRMKNFKVINQWNEVFLTESQASKFYQEHKERNFYSELIKYMISDKIQIFKVRGVIQDMRDIVGDTDPKKAKTDTLRFKYGKNKTQNFIHCSDSNESAKREIKFFENLKNKC